MSARAQAQDQQQFQLLRGLASKLVRQAKAHYARAISCRRRSMLRVALVGALLLAPAAAVGNPGAAWKALREGGHVGLMRHADAPGGAGDPPGFRLDDCATQRNLSDKGRKTRSR